MMHTEIPVWYDQSGKRVIVPPMETMYAMA